MENGDKVYLYDDGIGIMVFDLFGTYIQTLPITGISSFQADGEHILYLQDNELMIYSTLNFLPAQLDLPVEDVKQILKVKNQLVLSNGKSIQIYKLSPKWKSKPAIIININTTASKLIPIEPLI